MMFANRTSDRYLGCSELSVSLVVAVAADVCLIPRFLSGLDISALRYLIPSIALLTSNPSRDDQSVSQRAYPSSSAD